MQFGAINQYASLFRALYGKLTAGMSYRATMKKAGVQGSFGFISFMNRDSGTIQMFSYMRLRA